MFGESTWNLHPLLPMQKLKAGITLVSLITEKPIIPVIFEYVESAQICKKKAVYMISVLYNSVHRIM